MDRKLLEQLFYDGIMPRERCCPHKQEYHDTMQLCDTVEQELVSHLSPELSQMFHDYKDYAGKLTTMENGEHFIQGVALGIRIVAEAFTLDDNKTE
ncbi:DUF6809 family protein [Faecalicatena contorta]|uniref:DUF6809 family protein n=1 Tax=Faecalicatena contorta TaxID=39482 RepID=UPI001F2BAC94|nr:DUF6809 family protein [Faecalicatena contorta]MCF2683818.1 hypothetical protein [Faecalicatena contorta]